MTWALSKCWKPKTIFIFPNNSAVSWATVCFTYPPTQALERWSWSWNLYELRVTVIKTGFLLAVHIFSDRDHHKKKFCNYVVVIASLAKLYLFLSGAIDAFTLYIKGSSVLNSVAYLQVDSHQKLTYYIVNQANI